MLGKVNFHSRLQSRAWTEYAVLVLAFATGIVLVAGAQLSTMS